MYAGPANLATRYLEIADSILWGKSLLSSLPPLDQSNQIDVWFKDCEKEHIGWDALATSLENLKLNYSLEKAQSLYFKLIFSAVHLWNKEEKDSSWAWVYPDDYVLKKLEEIEQMQDHQVLRVSSSDIPYPIEAAVQVILKSLVTSGLLRESGWIFSVIGSMDSGDTPPKNIFEMNPTAYSFTLRDRKENIRKFIELSF